jgi:hypothetical protein
MFLEKCSIVTMKYYIGKLVSAIHVFICKLTASFGTPLLLHFSSQDLTFPKDNTILEKSSYLYSKNSAFDCLTRFFQNKPHGVTVFWTIKAINKVFIVKHAKETCNVRAVYVNCKGINPSQFNWFLASRLNIDGEKYPNIRSSYLASNLGPYTFIVLDGCDDMINTNNAVLNDIMYWATESHFCRFNVLILLNEASNAKALLQKNEITSNVQLMGCEGCGRWYAEELNSFVTTFGEQRVNMVNDGGSLTSLCHDDIYLLQVRTCQEREKWQIGETFVRQFRGIQNV